MPLEIGGFGECGEADGLFALSGAAGVLAAGGEFLDQALKVVDRPSICCLAVLFFALDCFAGLSLGHGVSAPTVGFEFFVLEEHRSQRFAHVPFDVVG